MAWVESLKDREVNSCVMMALKFRIGDQAVISLLPDAVLFLLLIFYNKLQEISPALRMSIRMPAPTLYDDLAPGCLTHVMGAPAFDDLTTEAQPYFPFSIQRILSSVTHGLML